MMELKARDLRQEVRGKSITLKRYSVSGLQIIVKEVSMFSKQPWLS
jgi:hypothetical protein